MTGKNEPFTATECVVVSAQSEAALVHELGRISAYIGRVPDARLVDIAYTCSLERGERVFAAVVSTAQELRERLESAKERIKGGRTAKIRDKSGSYWYRERQCGEGAGKLAFVFPGAMSFYPGMMRDLATVHPECRAAFDELDEALDGIDDFRPSDFIFPPSARLAAEAAAFPSGAYSRTFISAYAGCAAMLQLLRKAGVSPDGVVGCGGGDLAAVLCAGAADAATERAERVKAVGELYRIVSKAVAREGLPPAVMATAIARKEEDFAAVAASFPKDAMTLAVDFSPRMKTYAIEPDAAQDVLAAFAAAGARTVRHALDRPFNTPKCESMVSAVRKFASD